MYLISAMTIALHGNDDSSVKIPRSGTLDPYTVMIQGIEHLLIFTKNRDRDSLLGPVESWRCFYSVCSN